MRRTQRKQLVKVCTFSRGSDLVGICDLQEDWLRSEDCAEFARRPEKSGPLTSGEVVERWGRTES